MMNYAATSETASTSSSKIKVTLNGLIPWRKWETYIFDQARGEHCRLSFKKDQILEVETLYENKKISHEYLHKVLAKSE
jgi:hypothetical protein